MLDSIKVLEKGGYIATDITPFNSPVVGLSHNEELVAYTILKSDKELTFSEMEITKHTYNGIEWKKQDLTWAAKLDQYLSSKEHNTHLISFDLQDHLLTIVVQTGNTEENRLLDTEVAIVTIIDDNLTETIDVSLEYDHQFETYPEVISVKTFDKGYIINTTSGALVLDKHGSVEVKIDDILNSYDIIDNHVIDLSMDGLKYYDLNSGVEIRNEDLPGSCLYVNSGQIYGFINNTRSISKLTTNNDNVIHNEILLSGNDFAFGGPNCEILQIARATDDTFYIALFEVDQFKLYQINYQAKIAKSKEIKVFSLFESPTIRYGTGLWNQLNPEQPILYTVGISSGQENINDIITQLNVELLGGNGPDVLVMDGLTINTLVDKGILVDLEDKVQTKHHFQSLFDIDVNKQGLYAIPARFTMPLIGGAPDTIEKTANSIELLRLIEESAPANGVTMNGLSDSQNTYGVIFNTSDGVFDLFYNVWGVSIWKDNKVNKENLTEFLDITKRIIKHNNLLSTAQIENTYGYNEIVLNNSVTNYMNTNSQAYCDNFTQIVSFVAGFWDFKNKNERTGALESLVGSDETPYCMTTNMLGVTNGGDIEGAVEFVEFIMSENVQTKNFYDGMPTHIESFNNIFENQCEQYNVKIVTDMGKLIDKLQPVELLEYPKSVIYKYAIRYYNDEIDANSVCSGVENETSLFFQEKT